MKRCAPGWANCGGFFDLPKLQAQLSERETRMASADFWSNRERAQGVVEEVSRLRNLITPMRELEREVEDFEALQQLALRKQIRRPVLQRKKKSSASMSGC